MITRSLCRCFSRRTLCALYALLTCAPAWATTEYSFDTGLRQDQFDWTIASDLSGQATPNILSELRWRDLRMWTFGFDMDHYVHRQRWMVSFALRYGAIIAGDNRDSDYLGDNRTLEFSRSENAADSGDLFTIRAGLGYRFGHRPRRGTLTWAVIPMAGWLSKELKLTLTDGYQTVATPGLTPPTGPLPNLDSRYDSDWQGPFIGIRAHIDSGHYARVSIAYYHERPDYNAEANWNLRADYAHPISFRHRADGRGNTVVLGVIWRPAPRWVSRLQFYRQRWHTTAGTDTLYFADGSQTQTRFNGANWSSTGVTISMSYLY